eukprot:11203044-Lingulodinium_polyedra.AAC.1
MGQWKYTSKQNNAPRNTLRFKTANAYKTCKPMHPREVARNNACSPRLAVAWLRLAGACRWGANMEQTHTH